MTINYGIMTDSGADFSIEYQKENDLILIPTRIIIDNEEYIDRENIFREEIIEKMIKDKAKTSTSVAPPIDFYNIIKEALDKYEKVLFISISSKMSATLQNAVMTAKKIDAERFIAIDTNSVSWGMSLLLDHAIRRRKQQIPLEQVVKEINEMKDNLELFFMVETLEYLRRGGRIGAAKSLLGRLAGVKPILTIQDGEITSYSTVKSFEEAMNVFYKLIKEKTEEFQTYSLVLIYGLDTPEFKEFSEIIKKEFQPINFQYEPIGANIICHAGPQIYGFGIVRVPEEAKDAYKL
ncbi:MAG: DegV family protein [Candidatus Heimdallarchaeaceae archaeon]